MLETTPNELLRDSATALPYKDKEGNEEEAKLRLVSYYVPEKKRGF